jgi:hypothetical protein
VALEAASEQGSPMISPSPSGSLHYAEASSPSGSMRQHGEAPPLASILKFCKRLLLDPFCVC